MEEEKAESAPSPSESYDSGYASDVIHEEDEEGDDEGASLSPMASKVVPEKRWRDDSRPRSSSRHRSPSHSRRPSWKPNLKRELSGDSSTLCRRDSIDSAMFKFDEESARSSRSRWSIEEQSPLQRSMTPTPRRSSPPRKNSTLLHPSTPHESMNIDDAHSFILPRRPPPPERQGSTLLHPSSPDLTPVAGPQEAEPLAFTFSLPIPVVPQRPSTSTPEPPRRPGPPPRKDSTLLHPSSPPEEAPIAHIPSDSSYFPILSKRNFSLPPTPQPTPTRDTHERRGSILHSALSDDEWEEPLHSALSDTEYESDDHSAEGDTESFEDKPEQVAVVARTGRMTRASRISLHNNQLRILQD